MKSFGDDKHRTRHENDKPSDDSPVSDPHIR